MGKATLFLGIDPGVNGGGLAVVEIPPNISENCLPTCRSAVIDRRNPPAYEPHARLLKENHFSTVIDRS
jgi:hypothetical protein